MRRAYEPGKNWKTFYVCPQCHVCRIYEAISFRYFTDDLGAKIMFAAKAGWQRVADKWHCPEHRIDDVAP